MRLSKSWKTSGAVLKAAGLETPKALAMVSDRAPSQASACSDLYSRELKMKKLGLAVRLLRKKLKADSSAKLWKRVRRGFLMGSCLGVAPALAMFWAGYAVDGQWVRKDGTNEWYLSSLGLASVMFVIIVPYLTFLMVLEHVARAENHDDVYFSACPMNDVEKVFGDREKPKLMPERCFRIFRLFVRVILNFCFFTYSLASLPPRDPDEPMNQTRHLLAWLEFSGLCFFVLWWGFHTVLLNIPDIPFLRKVESCDCIRDFLRFLGLHGEPGEPENRLRRVELIHQMADFSALRLLRLANPEEFMARVNFAHQKGRGWLLAAEVASVIFGAVIGVASMILKVSTTAFTAGTLITEWDEMQWLTLFGFLNNLAGLVNLEEVRSETWQWSTTSCIF